MMHVVGLTGGIGSGKSAAAGFFASLGVPVVDVDVIAHQLTAVGQPTLNAIIDKFGESFLLDNGELNRAALREKVFSDPASRGHLEAILHPAIHQQTVFELEQNRQAPYQILAIPLLFENTQFQDLIWRSLVVDCDASLQVSRAMQRSGLSEQAVKAIMATQISREKRKALADDVLENSGSLEELCKKVNEFHQKYIHTCIVSE